MSTSGRCPRVRRGDRPTGAERQPALLPRRGRPTRRRRHALRRGRPAAARLQRPAELLQQRRDPVPGSARQHVQGEDRRRRRARQLPLLLRRPRTRSSGPRSRSCRRERRSRPSRRSTTRSGRDEAATADLVETHRAPRRTARCAARVGSGDRRTVRRPPGPAAHGDQRVPPQGDARSRPDEPDHVEDDGPDHTISFNVPKYFPIMEFLKDGTVRINPKLDSAGRRCGRLRTTGRGRRRRRSAVRRGPAEARRRDLRRHRLLVLGPGQRRALPRVHDADLEARHVQLRLPPPSPDGRAHQGHRLRPAFSAHLSTSMVSAPDNSGDGPFQDAEGAEAGGIVSAGLRSTRERALSASTSGREAAAAHAARASDTNESKPWAARKSAWLRSATGSATCASWSMQTSTVMSWVPARPAAHRPGRRRDRCAATRLRPAGERRRSSPRSRRTTTAGRGAASASRCGASPAAVVWTGIRAPTGASGTNRRRGRRRRLGRGQHLDETTVVALPHPHLGPASRRARTARTAGCRAARWRRPRRPTARPAGRSTTATRGPPPGRTEAPSRSWSSDGAIGPSTVDAGSSGSTVSCRRRAGDPTARPTGTAAPTRTPAPTPALPASVPTPAPRPRRPRTGRTRRAPPPRVERPGQHRPERAGRARATVRKSPRWSTPAEPTVA